MPIIDIYAPTGGYRRDTQPTFLDVRETPHSRDVRYRDDALEKRLGYTGVGAGLPLGGSPMLLYDFLELSGSHHLLCATTGAIYRYLSGTWTVIKSGLSGELAGYHSAAVMNDAWHYTNGVDEVQVWSGSGNTTDLAGGGDYQSVDTTHIARGLAQYADRLLLFAPTEDGTLYPQRVRWSELGKTDEWNEAQGGGETSLVVHPGTITGGKLLGPELAIYKEKSIILCRYIGGPLVYAFNTVIPDTGCPAPRTIQDMGNVHIFMGEDDIYEFNGSAIQAIGEPVRREIFPAVSRDDLIKCHAVLNREENLYILFVPIGDTTPTRAYVFDYKRRIWEPPWRWKMTASADAELGSGLTWDTIPDAEWAVIAAANWDAWGAYAGRHNIVLGGLVDSGGTYTSAGPTTSGGYIYQYDGFSPNDSGATIAAYYQTSDLTGEKEYIDYWKRWTKLEYEAKGHTVIVSYSTDGGGSWNHIEQDTLTDDWERHTCFFDFSARKVRFEFKNETASERFWLRHIRVHYDVGSGI